MKRKAVFFFIIVAIVIGASLWASSHPDGLEKLGFISNDVSRQSIFKDYTFPGLRQTPLATTLAGIAGVILCSSLFGLYGLILVLKKKSINK